MRRRKTKITYWVVSLAVIAAAALSGTGSGEAGSIAGDLFAAVNASHADSADGDIALDTTSRRAPFSWISDSSIVAVATEMQRPAIDAARLQLQSWSSDTTMNLALLIARDHVALRDALDSLAFARHLPPARSALADSLLLPYQEQLTALYGLPARELERRFIVTQRATHARAITDLTALGALARDGDVKAMLTIRAIQSERLHLAQLDQWLQARHAADSIAAVAAAEQRERRRR